MSSMSRTDVLDYVRSLFANITIQFRRGTWAEWAASGRVLKSGEPGWDTTNKHLYVGDGVTPIVDLDPITSGPNGGPAGSVGWTEIENMPAYIAAGASPELARSAIGAGTPYVLPVAVPLFVRVLTGGEPRPTADPNVLVMWVGHDARPTNMLDTDMHFATEPPDAEAPTPPTGLSATDVQQTEFTVEWFAASDNVGVVEYEVQIEGVAAGTTSSLTWTETDLTPDTPYSVQIRARDEAGNWSPTSVSILVTTDAAAAPTHSIFAAGLTGTTVHSDGSGTGIVGNRFYATTPIRVKGMRLWNPVGAPAGFLTADFRFYMMGEDWQGSALPSNSVNFATAQVKQVTEDRVAGTWTEVLFDTPLDLLPIAIGASGPDCVILAYGNPGQYYATSDVAVSGAAVPSASLATLFLAEQLFKRPATTYPSTNDATHYCVDIIAEAL